VKTVVVDMRAQDLIGREGFHDAFAQTFGFPAFYGRTMDAWIDCMGALDDPSSGLTRDFGPDAGLVTLRLAGAEQLKTGAPAQWDDLIECSAAVNLRRIEAGQGPILALAF
jgi:hypothetical protein